MTITKEVRVEQYCDSVLAPRYIQRISVHQVRRKPTFADGYYYFISESIFAAKNTAVRFQGIL